MNFCVTSFSLPQAWSLTTYKGSIELLIQDVVQNAISQQAQANQHQSSSNRSWRVGKNHHCSNFGSAKQRYVTLLPASDSETLDQAFAEPHWRVLSDLKDLNLDWSDHFHFLQVVAAAVISLGNLCFYVSMLLTHYSAVLWQKLMSKFCQVVLPCQDFWMQEFASLHPTKQHLSSPWLMPRLELRQATRLAGKLGSSLDFPFLTMLTLPDLQFSLPQ